MERKEGSYGKGECCTYDFVTRIASQPTKREGERDPPTKTNGGFGSQLVVLQKEKTMALNAIVVEKHGEPTLMVLEK